MRQIIQTANNVFFSRGPHGPRAEMELVVTSIETEYGMVDEETPDGMIPLGRVADIKSDRFRVTASNLREIADLLADFANAADEEMKKLNEPLEQPKSDQPSLPLEPEESTGG